MSKYRILKEVYVDEYGGHGAPNYAVQELKMSYIKSILQFKKVETWQYIQHEDCYTAGCYKVRTQFNTIKEAETFVKKLTEGMKIQSIKRDIIKEIN